MKRTFLAGLAALAAAAAAVPAVAAAVGPPSGVYLFGDLRGPRKNVVCGSVGGVVYSIWFGAVGSNIDDVASVLRSNGAGAVKFSTAVPFIVDEAVGGKNFNIHYLPWAIMTFNPGSATAGTIVFLEVDTDGGAPTPGDGVIGFDNYFQSFDRKTGRLNLDFTAEFPHCPVGFSGSYEQ